MSKRSSGTLRLLAFVVVLVALVLTLPATLQVQAADDHIAVFGTMVVSNPPTNCNSPIATCFVGTVKGNFLNGTVNGQANTLNEIRDALKDLQRNHDAMATVRPVGVPTGVAAGQSGDEMLRALDVQLNLHPTVEVEALKPEIVDPR